MSIHFPFHLFRKLYFTLLVFAIILTTGTIGFMKIEGYTFIEAVYMSVITISTVGFTEVRPMDDAGMIFTGILILASIGTFTFFLTQMTSYFLDGEFIRLYKLYNMHSKINELDGHVIICGFGRNGREAASIFHNSHKPFVVIEKKPTRHNDLPFVVNHYLEDDATRDEALLEAGIGKASALLATLPDDADNLFIVLTARELNPKIKIISRASKDSTMKKLKSAGASNVIMPDKIGGAHMATLVLSPDVKEFIDLMATNSNEHFEIAELISARTVLLGDLNCWSETGATILGLKTTLGEYILNPSAKIKVERGNRLIVMGSKDQLNKAKKLLI
ncbi:MAG: NAD-binding protein [Bacteroidetes bacterium]|nr:NAD-binding protein [Bacteroidota bacterium]